jgi:hypothetical protein
MFSKNIVQIFKPEEAFPEVKIFAFILTSHNIVWTVDFQMPVCKLYLLFISADASKEKEKRVKSAAVCCCFKVSSPYMV